jgi:hypothetical protein
LLIKLIDFISTARDKELAKFFYPSETRYLNEIVHIAVLERAKGLDEKIIHAWLFMELKRYDLLLFKNYSLGKIERELKTLSITDKIQCKFLVLFKQLKFFLLPKKSCHQSYVESLSLIRPYTPRLVFILDDRKNN